MGAIGESYVALPQRAPRERRPSKRAKVDAPDVSTAEGQATAAAAAIDPAASGGGSSAAAVATVPAAAEPGAAEAGPASSRAAVQEAQDGAAAPAQQLAAYRSAAEEGFNFEYLDHTADVQLHAWGATLEEAFASVALCMFNYMTPLSGIAIDGDHTRQYEAEGHDLQSLLFNFLDELLFTFSTEFFVCKQLRVTSLDRERWRITAEGRGERFDRQRHVSGTEIKAITYSAMQINEMEGDAEIFVIVDI